jgi:hypothetical protein
MKTLGILEKSKSFWFLFVNLIVFFFLRFPSLFEPNWYGDEGVYQTLGMGIKSGRLLYQGIFDNKPPLLYIFYSLFKGNQFSLRLLSLIFGLLAIVAFFYLAKKLFKSKNALYFSTSIFTLLFGLPILEGNIANAENFMLFFILSAFYLALDYFKTKLENKMFFWTGIVLGLAFLFKIVAVFDFAALIVFLLIIKTPNNLSGKLYSKLLKELKDLYWLIIGFVIPIFTCALYFLTQGAFSDFITATLFSNVGYVGYGNKFIIPQGFLILKLILLVVFLAFVFFKRHKLTMETVLIWTWLSFSVFNALFSQRPYTHYLLVLLPSFCLLTGLLVEEKKLIKINLVFILAILFLSCKSFWLYTKVLPYYENFISFVVDGKSVASYQKFFDKKTPIDYQIAQYIKQNTTASDNIFIWGNNSQVYKLSNKLPPGKYTVAYHIQNYKDGIANTIDGLNMAKPKFIILMPNVGNYPFSLSNYKPTVAIGQVYIYERTLP